MSLLEKSLTFAFMLTVSVNVTDFELEQLLVVDVLRMLGVLLGVDISVMSCRARVVLTDEIGVTVRSGLLKFRLSFGRPDSRFSISAQVSCISFCVDVSWRLIPSSCASETFESFFGLRSTDFVAESAEIEDIDEETDSLNGCESVFGSDWYEVPLELADLREIFRIEPFLSRETDT